MLKGNFLYPHRDVTCKVYAYVQFLVYTIHRHRTPFQAPATSIIFFFHQVSYIITGTEKTNIWLCLNDNNVDIIVIFFNEGNKFKCAMDFC